MRSADLPQIVAPVRLADGGLPTLRAGQDAYGAAIQQVNAPGSGPAPIAPQGGMSQTDFAGRGKIDADKIARQQAQLQALLKSRDTKPTKKARGGGIHPAIHHHIAHALIKLAEGGTVDEHAHLAALSPYSDDPEPTEKQKQTGSYRKGHMRLHGLDISIENPAGSKRRPEWPELKSHYGYLRGTHSSDDSHVDVFVKPGTKLAHGGPVHIVDQIKTDGMHDEPKVLMGWPDKDSAKQGYLENYEPGWSGMGALSETSPEKFKDWVLNGTKSAPYAKRAFTKTEDGKYMCHGGEL